MVYFPARKCYHAAKIGILLILVVALLAFFERWRGGKRSTGATFSDSIEAEYERQILEDEARIIPGLGEGGVAAHLVGEDKRLGEESEKKLAMNVYLSDRISYNRTLKDSRNPACKRMEYDAELPSASVILIFHNEPYSVVVRTIWSVVNSARRTNEWFSKANYVERDTGRTMTLGYPGQDPSSPFVYLKEIILVDDNSTLPELKGKLSHYVRTRLPPDLIRILRLPDRVGLTRARLAGARYAVGDVLVFLDAHCEVQPDWLRPLLHEIKHNPHSALVPIIDVIDSSNFYYSVQDPVSFQVGGFTFTGHFTWIDVPEREKKRRGSDIAPTWSPTMAGGLFAINRAYYWELGAYDEQMAGWGGENLEMSFRIWQCGGTLETIPCSRVGHVFRSFHPYGLPANSDTHGINTARMAEVWMDEYAELFYLHRPDLRNNPKIGDVTHRKILREKLHCKNFQWYLDNIYKEKFVPVRDVYGYGRFVNPGSGLCLDTLQREGEAVALGAYPCHPQLQATQYFSLSLAGELRDEENCATVHYTRRESQPDEDVSRKVLMSTCHGKQRGQKWEYDANSGSLLHSESGLCLSAGAAGADVAARTCHRTPDQRWLIDYAEYNNFVRNDVEAGDRDIKLKQLRGLRRISRSLLSYESSETNAIENLRRKSHKGKKHKRRKHKRTKNKFIVKLVRTLGNGSEEHLEVDIHCTHRQLYPNNSFVRDIVTILNDRNIKVINNGRVFEKNKVTEVGRSHVHKDKKVLNKMDIAQDNEPQVEVPKKHSKKHKQRATEPPPSPPGGVPQGPQGAPGGQDHRIIIEDFVEVRPSTVPTKRPKKHKKARARASSSPAPSSGELEAPPAAEHSAPPADLLLKTPAQSEENKQVTLPDSIEDAPMLGTDNEQEQKQRIDKENTDVYALNEDWPVGESRFRSKGSAPVQPLRREAEQPCDTHKDITRNELQEDLKPIDEARDDTRDDTRGDTRAEARRGGAGDAEGRPVRLVMRTNLTFNLGHEFFKRAQQLAQRSEDGSELLVHSAARSVPPIDLLVAPPRPPPAQTRPPPAPRPQPRGQATGQDSDSEHSSSSSDSSGDT